MNTPSVPQEPGRAGWNGGVISGRLPRRSSADQELPGGEGLASVTLRMFGRVEQQTNDRGGQPGAPDKPRLGHGRLVGGSNLGERTLDGVVDVCEQDVCRDGAIWFGFPRRVAPLLVRQLLVSRVGEQAIEGAHRVLHVISDRRPRGIRDRPDLGRREACKGRLKFLRALKERVGDGLQERRDAVDRTALPDFGPRHFGELYRTRREGRLTVLGQAGLGASGCESGTHAQTPG